MELTLAILRREGLLEPSRKRALPRFPKRIAIVTSPDGAVLRDIVAVLRRRSSGLELVVCPAKVQGPGAAEEIASALARSARWGGADVIIVCRGGGGREDLWAFNDERVARAVAGSPAPVISAIGHEADITVCDAVADLRAPTPSAAAAAACGSRDELSNAIAIARRDLRNTAQARVNGARADLDRRGRSIVRESQRLVAGKKSALGTSAAKLNALSPLATLARGYAVARDSAGAALTSSRQFRPGLGFELLLRDGHVDATTDDVTTDDRANRSTGI